MQLKDVLNLNGRCVLDTGPFLPTAITDLFKKNPHLHGFKPEDIEQRLCDVMDRYALFLETHFFTIPEVCDEIENYILILEEKLYGLLDYNRERALVRHEEEKTRIKKIIKLFSEIITYQDFIKQRARGSVTEFAPMYRREYEILVRRLVEVSEEFILKGSGRHHKRKKEKHTDERIIAQALMFAKDQRMPSIVVTSDPHLRNIADHMREKGFDELDLKHRDRARNTEVYFGRSQKDGYELLGG